MGSTTFEKGLMRVAGVVLVAGIGLTACSTERVSSEAGFSGGCAKFRVYAQNRWDPLGAGIWPIPNVLSKQLGAYNGDDIIAVNGWFHYGQIVYPHNEAPYDSNIWYHLADRSGYVDYAGVRGEPTAPDVSGLGYGGVPAPLPRNCEGTYKS